MLAARNADVYHALLAGVGLRQRPSAPAASPVKPCLCQHSVPAACAIVFAVPLPLLPRADGCRVSIRHRSQALGPRLPSPKNKSGLLPEFHFSPYQCARGVCVGAVSAICMLSGSPGTALGACKFSVKCDIVITKRHFFLGGRFQRGLILDSPHDFATALGRPTHARPHHP